MSGRNSAVECQLPKLDVAGSIPVARSNKIRELPSIWEPLLFRKEYRHEDAERPFCPGYSGSSRFFLFR